MKNDACLKCRIIGVMFLIAITLLETVVITHYLPFTALGFLITFIVTGLFNIAVFVFATKYRDTYHKCEEEECDE